MLQVSWTDRPVHQLSDRDLEKEGRELIRFHDMMARNVLITPVITTAEYTGYGQLYVPKSNVTQIGAAFGGFSTTVQRIQDVCLELLNRAMKITPQADIATKAGAVQFLERVEVALVDIIDSYRDYPDFNKKLPPFRDTMATTIPTLRTILDIDARDVPVTMVEPNTKRVYHTNIYADPQFTTLYGVVQNRRNHEVLLVEVNDRGVIESANVLQSHKGPYKNQGLLNYLENLLGKERLKRILKRVHTAEHYGALVKGDHPFTVGDIKAVMAESAIIRREDIDELAQEMTEWMNPMECRYFRGIENLDARQAITAATANLKKGKSTFNPEVLKILTSLLVPIAEPESIFFGELPINGSQYELAWVLTHLRTGKSVTEVEWATKLTKKIALHDLEPGLLIPHLYGFYQVMNPIVGAGAHIIPFTALSKQGNRFRSCLLFRGKQNLSATAWLDNFRKSPGSQAVHATYRAVDELVTDPEKGFVADSHALFWAVGSGWGGNYACRFTAVYPQRINRLLTVNGVQVDHKTAKIYASVMKLNTHQTHLRHIVDKDDVVPYFGCVMLGVDCTPDKVLCDTVVIEPIEDSRQNPPEYPLDLARQVGVFPGGLYGGMVKRLQSALKHSHMEDRTALRHRIHTINNGADTLYYKQFKERLERIGKAWEAFRPAPLGIAGEFSNWLYVHIYTGIPGYLEKNHEK